MNGKNDSALHSYKAAIIIFFIIPCLISGCSAKVSLDEETQAKLDEDTVHAMEDVSRYLSEKYSIDYDITFFEPIISSSTNGDWFVRTDYYGEWGGEFIVNGETYNIGGDIPDNRYADTYQFGEIQTAYTELMRHYFADVCEEDGIVCRAKVLDGKVSNIYGDEVLISVYYDGTNLYDCLKENGIEIEIDITDAGYSEELLASCEKSVADLEKDYGEAKLTVRIVDGKEEMTLKSN